MAEQPGRAGLADQEGVAVIVLLADEVAGAERAGPGGAGGGRGPPVASPADGRSRPGQGEDGPQRPGQAFGVTVEPLVQRGEAVEVVDRLAQPVDVQDRGPSS